MMKNRKIYTILRWLFLMVYIVVTLSFSHKEAQKVICNKINVSVDDSLVNSFITKRDIIRVIEKKGKTPIGMNICDVNTLELEEKLSSFNTVKSVEAYKSATGQLSISVTQRKPIVRIINQNNQSYYFDEEGKIFPWSYNYTSHVLVINGHIKEPFKITNNLNVSSWKPNEQDSIQPFIYKLFEFAQFITQDKFWNAQIAQVYVDRENDIELIPRIGGHIILLGGLDNYEKKLKKLNLFYKKALPSEGWNKYKTINLKYKNQVVCTKR
jgi:cell division protein FtsQ